MRWTDTHEIAIALAERYPETDPQWIAFTDLHERICRLEGFTDQPQASNEKILEAIQMAWIDEADR